MIKAYSNSNAIKLYPHLPAFMESGRLVIGHNGLSSSCKNLDNPQSYYAEEFELFTYYTYYKEEQSTPIFIYKPDNIPYRLKTIQRMDDSGNLVPTSYIQPCDEDTYLCICDNCGKRFVVDHRKSKFFRERNLTVPIVRCSDCINRRKRK